MSRLDEAVWRKSSFCNGASTCAEVAFLDNGNVALRDSKVQDGPVLVFTRAEFDAFVAGVKAGEFDCLATAEALPVGDGSDGDGRARAQKAAVAEFEASQVSR